MNPIRQVGQDSILNTEQGKFIKQTAVEAARRQFVGRKLVGPSGIFGPLGRGVITFNYDTRTHGSDARIDYGWPGAESKDIQNFARTAVTIPNVHQEFEINALDLAASQLTGQPLNMSEVESKSYKVALKEDELIIQGWSRDGGSTYEINGLYNAAGNSEGSDLDWGTKANIETSIVNALGLLEADNIPGPFNLTLNPVQKSQANALIANTSKSWVSWIRETIGGEVYSSPAVTPDTGLITPVNPQGMFELVLAEDLTVHLETLPKSGNLFGKVYIRGLPVVYDSNAICKLTTI